MYGKKPVISCAAGIEPAHPTARLICISGSLGRSLLVRVATLLAAFSPAAAISNPRNAPRIDECANARPQCCALPISPLPFRSRRWARATLHASHCGAPLPFPTHRGLRSLRSRAPRHAFQLWARRACYLLSDECRGCRGCRGHKKKPPFFEKTGGEETLHCLAACFGI